jgi:radical SAM protein with 4Fe4S-binding SPASM domain
MASLTKDYSRHTKGDEGYAEAIDNFIATHHPNREGWIKYREKWKSNSSELLYVLLETTSECNLTCPMCIHSIGYDKAPRMKDVLFEVALKNIADMKVPAVCMNQINEPLLDKNIFERISRVNDLPEIVDVHMNTNAVLLDDDRSRKIIDSGLTKILIGFDAFSKETYEKTRTGGASFDEVKKNILNFISIRDSLGSVFPVIRMSFVRTSVNDHEISQWVDFWYDKVDILSVQEFISPVLDDSRNYLLSESNTRPKNIDDITCRQPFERVTIRGDGEVLPCCSQQSPKMPIGNIKEDSLGEIWRGEKMEALRESFSNGAWKEHPICGPCLKLSHGISLTE